MEKKIIAEGRVVHRVSTKIRTPHLPNPSSSVPHRPNLIMTVASIIKDLLSSRGRELYALPVNWHKLGPTKVDRVLPIQFDQDVMFVGYKAGIKILSYLSSHFFFFLPRANAFSSKLGMNFIACVHLHLTM